MGGRPVTRIQKLFNCLIDNGADVKAKNDDGNTPLHWAAFHNKNPEVIQLLIDNGANVFALDDVFVIPYFYALIAFLYGEDSNFDKVNIITKQMRYVLFGI